MGKYASNDVENKISHLQTLDAVSDRNMELIEDFVAYLRADPEVSVDRIYKYLYLFETLFEKFIDFDLDTATKKQMMKAVGRMEASDYSDWTRKDWKVAIGRLYRTLWEDEIDRPDNIRRILNARYMKIGKIENKKKTEALTPEEVMAMVEQASTHRDKFLPLFMMECGARVSEITAVKLRDVELKEKYAEVEFITLKNDKGPRKLTLTRCVDLLRRWLEVHPRRDEPDSPLLVNVGGGRGSKRGDPMQPRNIARVLTKLGEEAGIAKRITPHIMRHSSCSWAATELNYGISSMMFKYGWQSPEQARTYCHESSKRMQQKRLEEEGITVTDGGDPTKRKTCPKCGENWSPTRKYCKKCFHDLDEDVAEADETLSKQELLQQMQELQQRVEQLA